MAGKHGKTKDGRFCNKIGTVSWYPEIYCVSRGYVGKEEPSRQPRNARGLPSECQTPTKKKSILCANAFSDVYDYPLEGILREFDTVPQGLREKVRIFSLCPSNCSLLLVRSLYRLVDFYLTVYIASAARRFQMKNLPLHRSESAFIVRGFAALFLGRVLIPSWFTP